jgi:hypothetical protein
MAAVKFQPAPLPKHQMEPDGDISSHKNLNSLGMLAGILLKSGLIIFI